MADISAATVMKLRKMSGQGMMDCKKALTETDGDLDKAMEILKEKGLATMAKRAERDCTEGRVIAAASDDKKNVAVASICCETDFVAKSDDFIALAETMTPITLTCAGTDGADAINDTEVDGKKFNGYRDKEGMAAFEKEMAPLANEEVKIKFPKLTLDDINMDQYDPEDLDILVTFGIIQDDVESE